MCIRDRNNTINPKQILDYIHREINGNRVTISDLDQILSWISRSRNKIKQDKPLDFEPQVRNFTKIYNAYEAYKKAHNLSLIHIFSGQGQNEYLMA